MISEVLYVTARIRNLYCICGWELLKEETKIQNSPEEMEVVLIPPPQIHPELLQTWCLTSKTALYLSGSTKDFTVACLRSAHGGTHISSCGSAGHPQSHFTQQIKLVADVLPGDLPAWLKMPVYFE